MTDTTDILITPDDLPYRLPAESYAYLVRTLARGLPPLPDDSPETAALRKQSIIARISALRPNDMIEAELAADLIVATEQSRDAFHWVYVYRANGEHRLAAQCRAQGISLQRETKRTLREIHRLQAETRERHADHAATDTAERIEHITMVTTAEAIDRMPDPTPEPYVPQRPAPGVTRQPTISKTDPQSRETKTETPPRQPDRPKESPARRALLDQAQFAPRGPNWDRPMFFPDKRAAKAPEPAENPRPPTARR